MKIQTSIKAHSVKLEQRWQLFDPTVLLGLFYVFGIPFLLGLNMGLDVSSDAFTTAFVWMSDPHVFQNWKTAHGVLVTVILLSYIVLALPLFAWYIWSHIRSFPKYIELKKNHVRYGEGNRVLIEWTASQLHGFEVKRFKIRRLQAPLAKPKEVEMGFLQLDQAVLLLPLSRLENQKALQKSLEKIPPFSSPSVNQPEQQSKKLLFRMGRFSPHPALRVGALLMIIWIGIASELLLYVRIQNMLICCPQAVNLGFLKAMLWAFPMFSLVLLGAFIGLMNRNKNSSTSFELHPQHVDLESKTIIKTEGSPQLAWILMSNEWGFWDPQKQELVCMKPWPIKGITQHYKNLIKAQTQR